MRISLSILIVAVFILSSCSPDVYKDKSFFSKRQSDEQTLAILPFEVIYTGNLPKNWTTEHIIKLEKEQSAQLQEVIYEELLFHASSRNKRKKWPVRLMDLRVVNDKLVENGISLHESFKLPSAEMSRILGTDMLIRGRVQNVRYMSQAAAAGINIGTSILEGILSRSGTSVYGPRVRSEASDMDLSLYHSSRAEAVARINDRHRLRIKALPVYVKN